MGPLLSYLLASLRYPSLSEFASGGLGIEARYKRCATFWAPHLDLSKRFVEEGVLSGSEPRERLIILGAGRLLDIHLAPLAKQFSEVLLIDGDATAVPYWRRAKRHHANVTWKVTEITGVLAPWTRAIREYLAQTPYSPRTVTKLGHLLENLATWTPERGDSETIAQRGDVVISLNLLSQLPLFWRDGVVRLLEEYWGIETTDDGAIPEPAVAHGINRCSAALIRGHLRELGAASHVVALTDIFFHYYHPNRAAWRTENALPIPEHDEYLDYQVCDGQAIGASVPDSHHIATPLTPPHHQITHTSRWLWHLAPHGIEHQSHGEIHEVLGFVSSRT